MVATLSRGLTSPNIGEMWQIDEKLIRALPEQLEKLSLP
jgi:hypothetical protein